MTIAQEITQARKLITGRLNWIKGDFERDGAHCAIGAVEEFRTKRRTLPYLFNALPKKFRNPKVTDLWEMQDEVIRFNDAKKTRKRQVLRMFDRAAQLAQQTKGNRKLLVIRATEA